VEYVEDQEQLLDVQTTQPVTTILQQIAMTDHVIHSMLAEYAEALEQ
jgi:hypothetical protein